MVSSCGASGVFAGSRLLTEASQDEVEHNNDESNSQCGEGDSHCAGVYCTANAPALSRRDGDRPATHDPIS
jgi:hypothetical protein